MKIKKELLKNESESLQHSLTAFLDGLSDDLINEICQCVVDHYNDKIDQCEG